MGHISGTWELHLCEYWRKSMIIGEKNTDLKRLVKRERNQVALFLLIYIQQLLCNEEQIYVWIKINIKYWRKSMIIGEKNTDLKRLTEWLKLCLLTEIGRLHWNQGEETLSHFSTPRHERGSNSKVIGTDCTSSCTIKQLSGG
jgi:hypothetical protein